MNNVNANYNTGFNSIYGQSQSQMNFSPISSQQSSYGMDRMCRFPQQAAQYGAQSNPLEGIVQTLVQLVTGLVSAVQQLISGLTGGSAQSAGTSGLPTFDTGSGSTSSTGEKKSGFFDKILDKGLNWLGSLFSDSDKESTSTKGSDSKSSGFDWGSLISKGLDWIGFQSKKAENSYKILFI